MSKNELFKKYDKYFKYLVSIGYKIKITNNEIFIKSKIDGKEISMNFVEFEKLASHISNVQKLMIEELCYFYEVTNDG